MDAAELAKCRKEYYEKNHESPLLDSLRQKKFLLLLDRANINDKIAKLPAAPAAPAADLNAGERKVLQDALANCNSAINSIETQITSATSVISKHRNNLLMPNFGQENEVDNQHLRLQVPLFDPMLNNPTIDDFWKKLVDYGEGLNWSEIGFKKALSNLLQQEAYKLYWTMRGKSLKDILAALEGSFHNNETILDLQKQLDSCTRQPGQTITNFMNNISSLIYQTTPLRSGPKEAIDAIENEIKRVKLMENASAAAKNAIFRARHKSIKQGICLSYDECLIIAKEAEHDEGLPISHAT